MSVATPQGTEAVGAANTHTPGGPTRAKRRKPKKTVDTRSSSGETFRVPNSLEHILTPSDSLGHLLIHYGDLPHTTPHLTSRHTTSPHGQPLRALSWSWAVWDGIYLE
eukprot:m.265103 g.265103  ORF g.265103 m.265103 type:complete len:108 (-) comp26740_c0_seq2:1258-1581(-)